MFARDEGCCYFGPGGWYVIWDGKGAGTGICVGTKTSARKAHKPLTGGFLTDGVFE